MLHWRNFPLLCSSSNTCTAPTTLHFITWRQTTTSTSYQTQPFFPIYELNITSILPVSLRSSILIYVHLLQQRFRGKKPAFRLHQPSELTFPPSPNLSPPPAHLGSSSTRPSKYSNNLLRYHIITYP